MDDRSETSTEIAVTWNSGQENLLAAIADRCNCYRWLHAKSQTLFDSLNFYLTVPSIAVSAIAGSASIGLTSLFPESHDQKYATVFIGIITLSTGVLSTINQYMKSSQLAEANRASAAAFGKIHRVISQELALRRDQRVNSVIFLNNIRTELDRLQDTSPTIPESVILKFRKEFGSNTLLEKPEITGDLDHVTVNRSIKNSSASPASETVETPVWPTSRVAAVTPE